MHPCNLGILHRSSNMKAAVFSAKDYDIESFQNTKDQLQSAVELTFLEQKLDQRTAILARDHDAVIAFVNDRCDAAVLEQLAELQIRIIAMRCAGYNNVDLNKAKELGITVVRVPAYSPEAVAEFTVGLMLTVLRKYHKSFARVRDGNFTLSGLTGLNLHGRQIGLVGTGKIGLCVGRILSKGFQGKVIAYDVKKDEKAAAEAGITYVDSLDELLQSSEIISLHAPLLKSTRHIIDKQALGKMRNGATLINTSRGGLIDTKALVSVLKTGKLRAVALDVYEYEEDYFFIDSSSKVIHDDTLSRLLSFHNVFVSGHQAFLTEEALAGIAGTTLKNIESLNDGSKCENEVSA
ncbi:D-lactate dehydrogenase [Auriculariales sp. MPI-PUGE-AT-0066]|nr:D-lactate dehydrogenase [Auriculariales sp. MPI-PUGE-AT-0066]